MAFQSIFDTGPCLVRVDALHTGSGLFSGYLTKGQTSSPFNGSAGPSEQMSVGVDINGVVTLLNLDGSTALQDNYFVTVEPDDWEWTTGQAEAANVSIWLTSSSQVGAYVFFETSNHLDVDLDFDASGTPALKNCSPNPAILGSDPSELAGQIGVWMGQAT